MGASSGGLRSAWGLGEAPGVPPAPLAAHNVRSGAKRLSETLSGGACVGTTYCSAHCMQVMPKEPPMTAVLHHLYITMDSFAMRKNLGLRGSVFYPSSQFCCELINEKVP